MRGSGVKVRGLAPGEQPEVQAGCRGTRWLQAACRVVARPEKGSGVASSARSSRARPSRRLPRCHFRSAQHHIFPQQRRGGHACWRSLSWLELVAVWGGGWTRVALTLTEEDAASWRQHTRGTQAALLGKMAVRQAPLQPAAVREKDAPRAVRLPAEVVRHTNTLVRVFLHQRDDEGGGDRLGGDTTGS